MQFLAPTISCVLLAMTFISGSMAESAPVKHTIENTRADFYSTTETLSILDHFSIGSVAYSTQAMSVDDDTCTVNNTCSVNNMCSVSAGGRCSALGSGSCSASGSGFCSVTGSSGQCSASGDGMGCSTAPVNQGGGGQCSTQGAGVCSTNTGDKNRGCSAWADGECSVIVSGLQSSSGPTCSAIGAGSFCSVQEGNTTTGMCTAGGPTQCSVVFGEATCSTLDSRGGVTGPDDDTGMCKVPEDDDEPDEDDEEPLPRGGTGGGGGLF